MRTSNTSLLCHGYSTYFIVLPSFSLHNFKERGFFFWSGWVLWTLSRVLYPPKVPNFAWQTCSVATYQLRMFFIVRCKIQICRTWRFISILLISLRPVSILASHLQLDHPTGTILNGFPNRILYESLLPHMGQISNAETIYKMHTDIGDKCWQKGQAFWITPLHNKTQTYQLRLRRRLKIKHLELCQFTQSSQELQLTIAILTDKICSNLLHSFTINDLLHYQSHLFIPTQCT